MTTGDTGDQQWTVIGHWENDQIVVEYVLDGVRQDSRKETHSWEQGLFAATGSGRTPEEALQRVREEYEPQYSTEDGRTR